jgi:hypothetical protein
MKNLDKLMNVIDTLIEEDKGVHMGRYLSRVNEGGFMVGVPVEDSHKCDTIGCILGWSYLLKATGEEVLLEDDYQWGDYVETAYGIEGASKEWVWLFSEFWEDSAEQAKRRLQYLIDNDRSPEEFIWDELEGLLYDTNHYLGEPNE